MIDESICRIVRHVEKKKSNDKDSIANCSPITFSLFATLITVVASNEINLLMKEDTR